MERRRSRAEINETDSSYREHSQESNSPRASRPANWQDDRASILILFFLYVLQGIPLGLAGSLPLILQNKSVSYKDQALFSFVTWPFSLKLLWAPIVDSAYWSWLGRRKSWLIPSQYLIGICMMCLAHNMAHLLGEEDEAPNVLMLTVAFCFMNFLAATQDIAVDGWALTMLSRHNVGYASTCNSVGQTAGFFLGNVVFLALESEKFSNSYIRSVPQPGGLVSISSFFMFWAYIFMITTTLIALLKHERRRGDMPRLRIADTYKMLIRIFFLPKILLMISVLMTCKIGFAATDAATALKLIEAGLPKEHAALLAIPMVPLQILLPLVISRYTAGPYPLSVFLRAYPYRLLCCVLFAGLLHWTHLVKLPDGTLPMHYYVVVILVYSAQQVSVYCIFVALMAFFAKISDPEIGGTYMTLLNTLTNLGGNWPATFALWSLDFLTFKTCANAPQLNCDTKESSLKCTEAGGHCLTTLDGYYIEVAVCVIFGFCWLRWGRQAIHTLQRAPASSWSYT